MTEAQMNALPVITDGMVVFNLDQGSFNFRVEGEDDESEWVPISTSTGNVTGPETSVIGNIATFDVTDGESIEDSGVAISDVNLPATLLARRRGLLKDALDTTKQIGNLGYIQFNAEGGTYGGIYVGSLNPVEFYEREIISTPNPSDFQVCTLFTSEVPGTGVSSSSALVEIKSSTGALLISRMTTTEREALEVNNDTNGMLVYDTTAGAFYGYQDDMWAQLDSAGGEVTQINAGTGITCTPNPIVETGTISITNTGVTAGSYNVANITVNSQGQVTNAVSSTRILDDANVNLFVGKTAGNTTLTGSDNCAFGNNSLNVNTVSQNSAFGSKSLQNNTTGTPNSSFGYQSLLTNTTGNNNSAFGANSLRINSTGNDNCAFGFNALNVSTVSSLSAFGSSSLQANTTGVRNSAFGYRALLSNTTGTDNTSFGYQALQSITIANFCSAFGATALLSNTGNNNSAFGYQALQSNLGAGANCAFGGNALKSNTTGASNSAFGYNSLTSNVSSNNNAAFGTSALSATTGANNAAFGVNSLNINTTGSGNSACGYQAGSARTTYTNCTFIGNGADASVNSLTNAIAIGANASVATSNSMVLGSGVNVGIGTSSPSYLFHTLSTSTADIDVGGFTSSYTGSGTNQTSLIFLKGTNGGYVAGYNGASNYGLKLGILSGSTKTEVMNITNYLSVGSVGINKAPSAGIDLDVLGITQCGGALNVLSTGNIKLYDSTNTRFVALKSPSTLAGSTTWTLPLTDGSANQFLKTDGAGTLSFASVTSSGFVDNVTLVTGDYTALLTDSVIAVNMTLPTTITLPASPATGQTYKIVDYAGTATTNNISINGNGKSVNDIILFPLPLTTLTPGTNPKDVAITPNGNYAYVTNSLSNNVTIIQNASSGSPSVLTTVGVGTSPYNVAITPNGNYAYVTNNGSNNVTIIQNASSGSPSVLTTLAIGTNVRGIAITPNGNYAYVANSGNVTIIQNASSGSPSVLTTLASGSVSYDVAITPNGNYAYVANSGSNNVTIIQNASSGSPSVLTTVSAGTNPQAVAITPNGNYAYVANSGSNNVTIIQNASSGSPSVLTTVGVGTSPNDVAITPNGNYAYVTNFSAGSLTIIQNASSGSPSVFNTISAGGIPTSVAITPDGNYVYNVATANVVINKNASLFYPLITSNYGGAYLIYNGNRWNAEKFAQLSPPSSQSSSLVLGTAYYNPFGYDIILNLYLNITANSSGSILSGVGSTSSPTQQTILSGVTTTGYFPITIYVPANYYALVSTSGTITVSIVGQQANAA
jgi:YVTN family beta-propeller protein